MSNNSSKQACGRRVKWRKFVDPRIYEQHLDLAQLLRNHRIQLVQIRGLGHLGLHRQKAVPNRLHRILERLRVAPGNCHPRALFLQLLRRRKRTSGNGAGRVRRTAKSQKQPLFMRFFCILRKHNRMAKTASEYPTLSTISLESGPDTWATYVRYNCHPCVRPLNEDSIGSARLAI